MRSANKLSRAIDLQEPLALQKPAPVLKWAGGKSKLLSHYKTFLPNSFNSYFEPFAGGAAMFFHLRSVRCSFQAELSDLNDELINCYTIIRDKLDLLVSSLKKYRNEEDYFYEIRSLDPSKLTTVERASRLIYLNKTCFNGLYRVNSQGKFNVPFGFYKNPQICNEARLQACSLALQNTLLVCRSFESVLEQAKSGDLIYFDPPYFPLSKTANFTAYTRSSFNMADQERLKECFVELDKRGCHLMLSNSDSDFIRMLYAQYRLETVQALRAINCKADARGAVNELLILNY